MFHKSPNAQGCIEDFARLRYRSARANKARYLFEHDSNAVERHQKQWIEHQEDVHGQLMLLAVTYKEQIQGDLNYEGP
jgi:hypothetical protein